MITASSETIDNAPTSNLTADVIAYFIEEELKEYFGIENNENHQTVFTKAPIITDSSRVKVSYGEDMTQQEVVYVGEIIPTEQSTPIPYTLTEYPPYTYSNPDVIETMAKRESAKRESAKLHEQDEETDGIVFNVANLKTPLFEILQLKTTHGEIGPVRGSATRSRSSGSATRSFSEISQCINTGSNTYRRRFRNRDDDPKNKAPFIFLNSSTSRLSETGLVVDEAFGNESKITGVYGGGILLESVYDEGIDETKSEGERVEDPELREARGTTAKVAYGNMYHEADIRATGAEFRRNVDEGNDTYVYINAVDGFQTYNFDTQEATGLNNQKLMVHDVVNNKQSEVSTDGLVVENRGGENTKCSVGSGQIRMSDYSEDSTSSHTTITKTSIDMNYGTAGANTTGILLNKDTGITVRDAEVDNLILTSSITGEGVLVANHSTKGTTQLNTSRVALTDVDSNNAITKQTSLTTSGLTVVDNTASPALDVSLDAAKINALLDIITAWNNTSSGDSLVKP